MKINHLFTSSLLIALVLAGPLSAQTRPSFDEKPAPEVLAGAETVSSVPVCDADGNYKGSSFHKYWQIVDKDPKGLIGRISKDWPEYLPGRPSDWPDVSNVDQWPETARFLPGSCVLAVTGNTGIVIVHDAVKKPWLLVSAGKGRVCFVRANKKFVMPVSLDTNSDCVADELGNFSSARAMVQSHWFVTVNDSVGLSGLQAKNWPVKGWSDSGTQRPDTSVITDWPVVDRFEAGEVLSAVFGNKGAIIIFDAAKRPWLLVRRHNGGECVVRANQSFISPVGMINEASSRMRNKVLGE